MKHVIGRVLFAQLLAGLATASLTPAPVRAEDQVVLCHFPPGNPDNFHTLTVGADAVDAHLRNHGDALGECCAIDDICDDGNACTANFCGDDACTSEPVDCDDGDPCTVEVGCDPDTGCISRPVVCDEGRACNSDTGACLPVGQCPCWLGSNPIERVTAAFAAVNPFPCVQPMPPTCDGNSIRQAGEGSGPNGASASVSVSLSRPTDAYSCQESPGGSGFGTCSCPPPPLECFGTGFNSVSTVKLFPDPTTCMEEFDAACAALQ
jgi:hypothetical protein